MMRQGQGHHAQDLVQGPTLDRIPDLVQDPDPTPDQDLTHDQAREVDHIQEVVAVLAGVALLLVVGLVHIHAQRRGEGPSLDLVVHITTDIKDPGVHLPFPQGNVMLEVGIIQKLATV